MILCSGDMWEEFNTSDLFLVTTNSWITKEGKLVMGRGIAREARDRFPGLDKTLGMKIKHLSKYGLLVSDSWPKKVLGAFQVKYDFKDLASLELIEYSVWCLQKFLNDHTVMNVNLNFPGIGNGGLDPLDVLDIVSVLPYNVALWTKTPLEDSVYWD